ncbi:MAG TPA: carbohydrate kinase family protein [Candidatus Saccharimonadales bacterium]|nr:carbohydrate kinase family protein [Candidatus Saccharimonadales bacterium]
MGKTQLVVCGSIAIDRIMNFSGHYRELIKPDKLHALSISMLLDKLEDSRGGIAANITSNLAMLGDDPVLLGSIGKDANGYIADLSKLGIDTENVHFSKLPTASFNVITDSEDSQVGGFYQGAMSDSESLSFAKWKDKDALAMVSAHNPEAMNRQISECQNLKIRLVYDPGQQISESKTDLEAGLEAAEVFLSNDYELSVLCHRISKTPEQLKALVPVFIVTLGKRGAVIDGTSVKKPIKIGIARPNTVVDPTGAGDGWRAGFLYGYLRQWDLQSSGQLGAVVASFIVEQHGTQRHFSKQQVIDRYKENFNQEIKL